MKDQYSFSEMIDEIRACIKKGSTDKAFIYFEKFLPQLKKEINNEIIILSGEFNQLKKDKRLNIKSLSDIQRDRNRINQSLLDVLEELSLDNFDDNTKQPYKSKIISDSISELQEIQKGLRNIDINTTSIATFIDFHQKENKNWCHIIDFKDLNRNKTISKVFVDLEYFVTPKRSQLSTEDNKTVISLSKIFDYTENHIVILGEPGAGKTTTMKKIVYQFNKSDSKLNPKFFIPVVIRLRELNELDVNSQNFIVKRLISIFGIEYQITNIGSKEMEISDSAFYWTWTHCGSFFLHKISFKNSRKDGR